VRVVPSDWLTLVEGKCKDSIADLPVNERRKLRGMLQLFDAARNEKRQKHEDVARGIAELGPVNGAMFDRMMKDPFGFVSEQVSERCKATSVVLWKQTDGVLSAGLLCGGGLVEALYALVLFQIACRRMAHTGECIICGAIFERKRGVRRKTCSDVCRTRASVARKRPAVTSLLEPESTPPATRTESSGAYPAGSS
jgi:hypothetical protein